MDDLTRRCNELSIDTTSTLKNQCKDLKIRGFHNKTKIELVKLLNDYSISKKWYKIPEIPFDDFVKCCLPIYNILEDNYKTISSVDPFLKSVLMSTAKADWDIIEKARLKQKNLEMKMGYFHEELIGKFNGYCTLPNGHHTGCDVSKNDETVIFEIKNRHNTVKGSDGKHIIAMLKKQKTLGKKAVFVQINCPNGKVNRYGDNFEIDIWNGKEVYEYLSGRDTFFEDLQSTVDYVFSNFKTLESLTKIL